MNFTMSFSELMPLAPVMIVSLTAIVVMLLTAIKRNHNLVATTTVIGLNLAAFYIIFNNIKFHTFIAFWLAFCHREV
jgi:NADH-quinone oxidoreductase subunit N